MSHESISKPEEVVELERVLGGPSQSGFGASVFYERSSPEDLDQVALLRYQYFVGKKWEQFGAENWLGVWELLYKRRSGTPADILRELAAISDPSARSSTCLLTDGHSDPQAACVALAAAFNDASISDLRIYKIGDGEAMSGILIAARQSETDLLLALLMD